MVFGKGQRIGGILRRDRQSEDWPLQDKGKHRTIRRQECFQEQKLTIMRDLKRRRSTVCTKGRRSWFILVEEWLVVPVKRLSMKGVTLCSTTPEIRGFCPGAPPWKWVKLEVIDRKRWERRRRYREPGQMSHTLHCQTAQPWKSEEGADQSDKAD